jgi:hypothetical protein
MVTTEVMPREINPKLTEAFLLSQSAVLDASVLWHDGNLYAYVTVDEGSEIRPVDLQRECVEVLGLHQTPRNIKLMRGRTFARVA